MSTTNPTDFSGGIPPRLAVSGNDSGGDRVQRLLPDGGMGAVSDTHQQLEPGIQDAEEV